MKTKLFIWEMKLSLTIGAILFIGLLAAQDLMPQPRRALVAHAHYSLDYNESAEQAYWVFYELTKAECLGGYERANNFRSDPKVRTRSAVSTDYRGSGYDRGHLAPAADMAFSSQAMTESFYMSNMSPQLPAFNRGIWKKLEAQVRAWAYEDGDLYIVSGPLFLENLGTLASGVRIPSHFFKVILDRDVGETRAVAFILPNARGSGSLKSYERSIDEVERLSGLDFFAALDDGEEESFESATTGYWNYRLRLEVTKTNSKSSSASQCLGITQSGRRCRRRTTNSSGYCWQHE
jgi:endonuclease G